MNPTACHLNAGAPTASGAQYEQFRLAEQARIEQAGQTRSSNVVFVKQTIGNACGTIGLIHSVCNNAHRIPLGTAAALARRRIAQGT